MQNEALQGTHAPAMLGQAVTPPPPVPSFCSDWPDRSFWQEITIAKLGACLPFEEIDAGSKYDETPLIWALQEPHVEIAIIHLLLSARPDLVAQLLSLGGDPNAQDEAGQMPLHRATKLNPDTTIALLLLQNGADRDIWGHEGRAAGDIEVTLQPYSSGNWRQTVIHREKVLV